MGLAQRPISPKGKDVVIMSGKPKGFSKKKPMRVKELRKNEMGRGCPKNEIGRGSPRHGMGWPNRNVGQ